MGRLGDREKTAALIGVAAAALYLVASWLAFSSWQGEMAAYFDGARAANGDALREPSFFENIPGMSLTLKLLMLPIPSVVGSASFWPFLVEGLFIGVLMIAMLLRPTWLTVLAAVWALFALLLLLSGELGRSLAGALAFGTPLIGLIGLIATTITQRLRAFKGSR